MRRKNEENRILEGAVMVGAAAAGTMLAFRAVRLIAAALIIGGKAGKGLARRRPDRSGGRR